MRTTPKRILRQLLHAIVRLNANWGGLCNLQQQETQQFKCHRNGFEWQWSFKRYAWYEPWGCILSSDADGFCFPGSRRAAELTWRFNWWPANQAECELSGSQTEPGLRKRACAWFISANVVPNLLNGGRARQSDDHALQVCWQHGPNPPTVPQSVASFKAPCLWRRKSNILLLESLGVRIVQGTIRKKDEVHIIQYHGVRLTKWPGQIRI